MDDELPDVPRERAVSSESCTTRANPFDDDERTPRKRQRVLSDDSPAMSADDSQASDTAGPRHLNGMATAGGATAPQTPPPLPNTPQYPTSAASINKVTLNLKPPRSSPTNSSKSQSPTPSHAPTYENASIGRTGMGRHASSEVVAIPTPDSETPGSSSAVGSPEVHLIIEDDSDDESPAVEIISDEGLLDVGLMEQFPYQNSDESLKSVLKRMALFFENGMWDSHCKSTAY